jgi:hypothetical protein
LLRKTGAPFLFIKMEVSKYFQFFFFFMVLGIESRALCMLGKSSCTVLHSQTSNKFLNENIEPLITTRTNDTQPIITY